MNSLPASYCCGLYLSDRSYLSRLPTAGTTPRCVVLDSHRLRCANLAAQLTQELGVRHARTTPVLTCGTVVFPCEKAAQRFWRVIVFLHGQFVSLQARFCHL